MVCPFSYKGIGKNLNLVFLETIIFKKHMLDLLASSLDKIPSLVDVADDLHCIMCCLIKNQ